MKFITRFQFVILSEAKDLSIGQDLARDPSQSLGMTALSIFPE
jgi:hypothetical protein